MQALTANQEKLLQIREELRQTERLADEIKAAIITEGCLHPDPEPYQWEHDDGYGRQTMITGRRCRFCGAKKPWRDMGSWYRDGAPVPPRPWDCDASDVYGPNMKG